MPNKTLACTGRPPVQGINVLGIHRIISARKQVFLDFAYALA
jgi:hypothetical protein